MIDTDYRYRKEIDGIYRKPIVHSYKDIRKADSMRYSNEMEDKTHSGYVYFIQCGDTRFFKIGFTNTILHRAQTLQIGCPYELFIRGFLATDNYESHEGRIHELCKTARVRGEWFRMTKEQEEWCLKHVFTDRPPSPRIETWREKERRDGQYKKTRRDKQMEHTLKRMRKSHNKRMNGIR